MTDLELNANRITEFSIKLCSVIKHYKCLHDRASLHKNPPRECIAAWQIVAKECNETIEYCKSRWKSLLKSFYIGLNRKGSRYYLHDYMQFLVKNKLKANHKPESITNDDASSTRSLPSNFSEDASQQEALGDTINIDDETPDGDSHNTSADELNVSYIINEIDEELEDEGDRESLEDLRKRLRHRRSCKRGLDPEILIDVDEDSQVEKRQRRSDTETRNSLQQKEVLNQNFDINLMKVRVDQVKLKKADVKVIDDRKEFNSKNNELQKTQKNKIMVDSFTSSDIQFKDEATQYENITGNLDYDQQFLDTIKLQLQQMNARQKLNFKRKIYESLLDVFDDNTNFPNGNEVLKLHPKSTTKVVNTTVGELRLMRELVSLVQAAKNTPEIMNATDKVKTSSTLIQNKPAQLPQQPSTQGHSITNPVVADNRSKTLNPLSPFSLSPSMDDDDDLQFSLDNIDDDDDATLPKSWDEIKLKPNNPGKSTNEENVMGLPKRVLQKVVRVSGANGSTIVARDGDKRRIYRIYPKTLSANGLPVASNANANSVGSFYMAPQKTNIDSPTTFNKNHSNVANITVRTLKPGSNVNELNVNSTQTPQTTSSQPANKLSTNQTIMKNLHTANRILSSSTGFFKVVQPTKTLSLCPSSKTSYVTDISNSTITTPNVNRIPVTKTTMMPPTIPSKRTVQQIRNHVTKPFITQRRFSICGPMPTEKTLPTQNTSVINQTPEKSPVSQIQISQPISLNTKANLQNNKTNTSANPSSSFNSNNNKIPEPIPKADDKLPVKKLETTQSFSPTNPVTTTAETKLTNQTGEIPIVQTAGTIGVDNLDPLFVKTSQIKMEPQDD